MKDPCEVAVVGVSGYSGLELAKILLRHQSAAPPVFYLREPGSARCLGELFPWFRGRGEGQVRPLSVESITRSGAGIVFLATPHEVSARLAPPLLEGGLKVIDLSGAFRFRSSATLSAWYQTEVPHEDWLSRAAYGIPELYASEIAGSQLVANPGCYATSVILGLWPLTRSGWVAAGSAIVCDCKSGASGAGKEPRPELQFVEVDENFKAYGLFTHRHTPEILEHTGWSESQLVFSTHLLPLSRGILSTLYVTLTEPRTGAEVEALFRSAYAGRKMVRIWPAGSLPELQHVAHTNYCDLGFVLDKQGRRLIVVSCLDNLGKGAAGQAVQNFNLMTGQEEQIALQ